MENIAPALLDWFYKNRRILPFREDPTPYHVWLSEVMLQQTRVSAVLPYYERFLAALPDIPALAACDEEKLHKLWEGLGYYSRVRNLQKAAKIVCEQYGGQLPADYAALRALPGIGDFTAGAIASISFGIPVPAVDGNVLRVFSRLYNDPGVITDPKVKKAFTARVMEHQPPEKAGDYNQALMELGALVCVPNGAPLCDVSSGPDFLLKMSVSFMLRLYPSRSLGNLSKRMAALVFCCSFHLLQCFSIICLLLLTICGRVSPFSILSGSHFPILSLSALLFASFFF